MSDKIEKHELFRLASLPRSSASTPISDDDDLVVNALANTARAMLREGNPYTFDGVAPHLHERIKARLEEPDQKAPGDHGAFAQGEAGPLLKKA